MPSLESISGSHFKFGYQDDSSNKWMGSYSREFVAPDESVYACGASLQQEVKDDLRREHFAFGTGAPATPQSSSQEAYIAYPGDHRSTLVESVRSDLRASHFSIGRNACNTWISTNHEAYLDQRITPVPPKSFKPEVRNNVFPWKDAIDFISESHRSFQSHPGCNRSEMASSIKADLRRSHFNHTGNGETDYSTTASSSYQYRQPERLYSSSNSDTAKSHFSIWGQGSMKDIQSVTKSDYTDPGKRW